MNSEHNTYFQYGFTDIIEIDYIIWRFINCRTANELRKINNYMKKLCIMTQEYYKNYIKTHYPLIFSKKKEKNECWKHYYLFLKSSIIFKRKTKTIILKKPVPIIYKRLGFLEIFRKNLSYKDTNEMCARGYLNSVYFMSVKLGNFPNVHGANLAATNGHLEMCKLLYSRGIAPSIKGLNKASSNGQYDVVTFFARKRLLPDKKGLNFTAANGHLQLLTTLMTKYHIYPDNYGASLAAGNGHIDICKYLYEHRIYPNIIGLNKACKHGFFLLIKWFAKKNLFPDTQGANYAAGYGHLNIIILLLKYNIFPDRKGANFAVIHGHEPIVEILLRRGIYPDLNILSVHKAISNNLTMQLLMRHYNVKSKTPSRL